MPLLLLLSLAYICTAASRSSPAVATSTTASVATATGADVVLPVVAIVDILVHALVKGRPVERPVRHDYTLCVLGLVTTPTKATVVPASVRSLCRAASRICWITYAVSVSSAISVCFQPVQNTTKTNKWQRVRAYRQMHPFGNRACRCQCMSRAQSRRRRQQMQQLQQSQWRPQQQRLALRLEETNQQWT